MVLLSIRASIKKKWRILALAILLYSVVFGARSGVGMDYFSYLHAWAYVNHGLELSFATDYGFYWFTKLMASSGLHYFYYFALIAFAQLYILACSVRSYPSVWPYFITFFCFSCPWLSFSNGMRQALAFCLFAYALTFVESKDSLKHYILMILAALVHKSALFLFIFYPLLQYRKEWFSNVKVELILICISLLLMAANVVSDNVDFLLAQFNWISMYEYYMNDSIVNENTAKLGLGYVVNLCMSVLLVYKSQGIKNYWNSTYVTIIYNLFFIGVNLHYIFLNSQVLSRINWYFGNFQVIFAAFALVYFRRKNSPCYYILLGLCLSTFIAVLYRADTNTALFQFFWQNETVNNMYLR